MLFRKTLLLKLRLVADNLERVVAGVDILEDGHFVRVPERERLGHVDGERLVALLQAAVGEVLERLDVLAEVEAHPLAGGERKARHELGLGANRLEGHLGAGRVHEQLAVEREAHRLVLHVDHDADNVAELTLLAERLARARVPLERRVAVERVRAGVVRHVQTRRTRGARPADLDRAQRHDLRLVVPLARADRVRLLASIGARRELLLLALVASRRRASVSAALAAAAAAVCRRSTLLG